MYICLRGIDCISVSTIVQLGFQTVLTVLCFYFILLFFDVWTILQIFISREIKLEKRDCQNNIVLFCTYNCESILVVMNRKKVTKAFYYRCCNIFV